MKVFLKQLLYSKKFYITFVSSLAGLVLLLFLANEYVMPAYTNYDEGVTVPDVTKLSLEEAEELLSSYGLRYEVAERRANQAFPPDYVIDQMPMPADIVKPNRKIYLTVNTASRPTVEVPDVQDLSLRNAEIQLQNYGLQIGTISYESSRFKNVLRQSTPPGEIVDRGSVIDLSVGDGLGEDTIEVPEIVGLNLTEVQQKLNEAGFRIGEIRFEPTRDTPPNVVIDFSPKAEELTEGETLQLIVSERFNLEEESESGPIRVDSTYQDESDTSDTSNVPDTTDQDNN